MAALALSAEADTFVLKDGSRIEGSIIREDATSYLIEVRVSKSIKDERVVAKDNIVKMEAEKKDLTAFDPISHYIPLPDALTADEYAARIATVEKFLKDYPDSSKASQARAILSILKNEANEILAGGIKFNGKVITAVEYRANVLDIDAGIHEARIRTLLKDGRYIEALRAFSAFDREFPNTKARAALLPAILQTINGYLAQNAQSLAGYDARVKEREISLQRMQPEDRRKTQEALAEEAAELDKQLKAEKEAKVGWVTPHPSCKLSLEETMTFGKQEITRLSAAAKPQAVDAGAAFRDALRAIQKSTDATAKTAALGEAKAAMVSGKYLAILETAAASK
jgi:tetratricopeptide (TPR) repeat protein